MRYWGTHRKSRLAGDARYASSPPENVSDHAAAGAGGRGGAERGAGDHGAVERGAFERGAPERGFPELRRMRPRRTQPRDSLGRFRRAGRDDNFAVRRPDGRRLSDFELDDPLPRTAPRAPDSAYRADGRRHCGALEPFLYRQWDARQGPPPPEVVRAIDSLATLPETLQRKLAGGVDGIYVGPGGVPDLDDMGHLSGIPLPSGKATWDICAGAYGDRKIVVGAMPSPTPDVMMHEVGHALDDIDGGDGAWLSDTPEFRALYDQCRPHLASEFHRQPDDLGRREFFADAFAAIAASQRPALIDMLGGQTRAALDVMLFFNRRYGI